MQNPAIKFFLIAALLAVAPTRAEAGPFGQFIKEWFSGWGTSAAKKAAPQTVRRAPARANTRNTDDSQFRDGARYLAEQAAQDQFKGAVQDRYDSQGRRKGRALNRDLIRRR